MKHRSYGCAFLVLALSLAPRPLSAQSMTVEGAPTDSGYNVGTMATIHATLKGVTGDEKRYAVFAEIQYVGTTGAVSVQMDREDSSPPGEVRYEMAWPIPPEAPTGLYSVALQVEDGSTHEVVMKQAIRGFAVYKKLLRIARLELDRTYYVAGEPIQCEVAIDNLTGQEMKGLRVEFSNANYPWISLYSGEANRSGKAPENPALALKVLKDDLALPAGGEVTLPMMPASTAAFLQGTNVAVLGAGAPARHEKTPPPEVDQYTVAVWDHDRTVLYDMQFTSPAIVRTWNQELPKPYSADYTHPYNSDIDFGKYREFYAPGETSAAIRVEATRTLYRSGDPVTLDLKVTNLGAPSERSLSITARIKDPAGHEFDAPRKLALGDLPGGETRAAKYDAWTAPRDAALGVYTITLSSWGPDGKLQAQTRHEIAVNRLPRSLLVFCPHEDDEHAYAGLIRAAVEAGIPVKVVIFTGGDVGACERYYAKTCGPNEAREFGMVRMEESAEVLEHIGLSRDKLSILGLPDGGSGEIWFHHLKESDPFLSIYLATDHAPYADVLKPNLPYARDAVIALVKQIIVDFRPAMIALSHPDERHVDHRTANWFVIKACQELLAEKHIDPETIILADQAYGEGGFKPAPYHYDKWPVYLSGEAAALKQESSWIYQSQDGNLAEGMRKAFDELPRQELHLRILDWQEHAGWNE